MSEPKISVVLPVYNASATLMASIASVLDQSFSAFELILIDDGSADDSLQIAQSVSDPRLRVYTQPNAGLAATLNRGVSLSRTDLIARMDNDDIAHPERLQRQFNFMSQNQDIVLLGTRAEIIDEKGAPTGRFLDHPLSPAALRFALYFNNPFVHASVVFRKPAFLAAGGYKTGDSFFEDHNLWSRITHYGRSANLPDRLMKYREVAAGMSRTTADYRERVINQSVENVMEVCRLPEAEIRAVVSLMHSGGRHTEYRKLRNPARQILQLIGDNMKAHGYDAGEVDAESARHYYGFLRHYYNSVLQSHDADVVSRLVARVKRRLLFSAGKLTA